jgi:hypothetical protein
MLPEEQRAAAEIRAQWQGVFVRMDATLDAVVALLSAGEWIVDSTEEVDRLTVDVVAVLLTKACKTFRSIELLCERGLVLDASVLLRCLFETSLCVRWVLACEPRQRSKMVVAHGDQRRLVYAEAAANTPELRGDETAAIVRLATENLETWVRVLGPELVASVRRHWSGTDTEQVARDVGWLALYNTVFRESSGHAHGSDFVDHLDLSHPQGPPVLRLHPDDEHLPRTTEIACWLLWEAADTANRRLGLGFDAVLQPVTPVVFDRDRR